MVAGMVVGMVASVVAAGIVFAVGDYGVDDAIPLSVVAILQAALWTGLLGVPLWLVVARGVRWADLGWGATARDAWQGLFIGIATQVAVVPVIYIPLFLMTDDLPPRLSDPSAMPPSYGGPVSVRPRPASCRARMALRTGTAIPGGDP